MTMTLFARPGCRKSEIIKCMLNEKSVEFRVLDVSHGDGLATAKEAFGSAVTPAIADKDTVLSDFDVIIEYIDERYPHPPLLPQGPHNRSTVRLFYRRMIADLYPKLAQFELDGSDESLNQLVGDLRFLSGIIQGKPFLLYTELSIADCAFLPLLHQVMQRNIEIDSAAKRYYDELICRQPINEALCGS